MSDKKLDKLINSLDFDEQNATALVDMLTDLNTSEHTRIAIINELNETSKSVDFFETAFNEEMTVGMCPHCAHKNHFLIPEDVLAQMGWVTSKQDQRVPKHTDSKICPEFAESCRKKKTSV